MTLMERFCNPEYIHGLTVSEKLIGSLITTALAMSITFIVLTLIWGFIAITGKIFKMLDEKENLQASGTAVADSAAATTLAPAETAPSPKVDAGIGPEVIAAITAAVLAVQGPNRSDNLVVRRISRVAGERPSWSAAGISENIQSRKI